MTHIIDHDARGFNEAPADAPQPIPPRVRAIVAEVCAAHDILMSTVLSDNRRLPAVNARAEAVRRIRNEIIIAGHPASYPQIGRWLGRDHTSIINLMRRAP